MTDLDRLLELEGLQWDSVYQDNFSELERLEYKSLYEKLSKAEEDAKNWNDLLLSHITLGSDSLSSILREIRELKQNQKSKEDIEKIKAFDEITNRLGSGIDQIMASVDIQQLLINTEELHILEKEIQKLSQDNKQLKEELFQLKQQHETTIKFYDRLEQDSKTNTKIVEKITEWTKQTMIDNINTSYVEFSHEKNTKFKCAEEVQSILKETK